MVQDSAGNILSYPAPTNILIYRPTESSYTAYKPGMR